MAFGAVDAAWYVVAGAAVAIGGALVFWFRRTFRWMGRRLKAAYLEWFAEAVDQHVQPQFDAIRDNTIRRAGEIRDEAAATAQHVHDEMLATAQEVKEQLRIHTAEEGELVRAIVKEEVAPIAAQLTEVQQTVAAHLGLDERRFEQAHQDLVTGQAGLVAELQSIKAAIEMEKP